MSVVFASKGIKKIPNISIFLQEESKAHKTIVGWGRKPSYFKAEKIANKEGLNPTCLEDGFIRSLGLGKQGYPPLSLVVDHQGIYFNAFEKSDLESLITESEDTQQNIRARKVIDTILKFGITKYNQKFEPLDIEDPLLASQNILVIDQTYGDQSIHYAGAGPHTFNEMLQKACADHPDATIWLKIHPDVLANKASAHFNSNDLKHKNIRLLTKAYNPIDLLKRMDEVYVVSSQLGFEALLCGKKVNCFGVPWYAGWGLTNDVNAPCEILGIRRNQKKTIEHLFQCAYLQYCRYVCPVSQKRCELEDLIDLLIPNICFQKRLDDTYIGYGFSSWKKKFIHDFLSYPHVKLKFKRKIHAKNYGSILAWGKKAEYLQQLGYKNIVTIEDGFIRSVGLGAQLIRPCSLVFDDIGIYYDATKPSRIENILNEIELDDGQIRRAKKLRSMLIDLSISKYNVGQRTRLVRPNCEKVLLVVGQVEDDMSILRGGLDIKTNLALLKKVKELNPDAYIIYKPHPDVESGLRIGRIPEKEALRYADKIEKQTSILEYFSIIDELHTITSLSGFEALIRGVKVHCYGMPFYAGWGLTQDQNQTDRRRKIVNIETLLYVTLVEYPTYNLKYLTKLGLVNARPEDVIYFIQGQVRKVVNQKKGYKHLLLSLLNLLKK